MTTESKTRSRNRGHNEGSFYQTGDGRWRAAITLHSVGGEPRRVYLSGRTKRELQQKAEDLRERARRGSLVGRDPLLREYLERWLEDSVRPSSRPRTYETYALHARRIVARLGGVRLAALTPAHLQQFYAEQLQRYAPKTVLLTHTVIRRALKQALRWKLILSNPTDAVDPPRVGQREYTTLTTEQVQRLLQATDERPDGHTALWTLLALTGMRRGEALGLRWQDVDLEAGRLVIRQQLGMLNGKLFISEPKTNRSRRTVVLAPRVVATLRAHQGRQTAMRLLADEAWRETGLVFTRPDGSPLHPMSLHYQWGRILERAGLPRIRLHDLRHTAATLLLQDGTHPRLVQELLGHSSVSMTLDLYSHVTPVLHAEVAARMERLVGQG